VFGGTAFSVASGVRDLRCIRRRKRKSMMRSRTAENITIATAIPALALVDSLPLGTVGVVTAATVVVPVGEFDVVTAVTAILTWKCSHNTFHFRLWT
jgi:hypothetical protein